MMFKEMKERFGYAIKRKALKKLNPFLGRRSIIRGFSQGREGNLEFNPVKSKG